MRATRRDFEANPPGDKRVQEVCKMSLGFMANLSQDMQCGVSPISSSDIVRICKLTGNPSNPGNPRTSLVKVAEDLAEVDAVSDTLWDLRGTILQALKDMGHIDPETSGPDVQSTIDHLIMRLTRLV